jgi:hypothetical protein
MSNYMGGGGGSNGRSAITTQGLGTFRWGDFTLTVYGCSRSGDRVFCDFDLTKQASAAANVGPFYTIAMVDDGGKITPRHDAFYMAADGTHMPTAYLSPTPVRFVMEFDNISPNCNMASLALGGDRVQGVPITNMDASQPAVGGVAPGAGRAPMGGGTQPVAQPYAGGGNPVATPAAANDPRAAVAAQGIGTFRGADFTLTVYRCYRSGTRLLCDFDLSRQNNGQANTAPFYTVALVDDGGKITTRHDAYYMAADGSHLATAYLSPAPVRYIMEYDDVGAQFASISLINGGDQIQGVPITNMDPNQPAGSMPGRGGQVQQAANGAQAPNAAGVQNGAQNAANQAGQAVNGAKSAKQKAKDWWNQVKTGATNGTKPN